MNDISNNLHFSVKLTSELDDLEIDQLNSLYNQTFQQFIDRSRNSEEFKTKFISNVLKYSFHGLIKQNEKIIGTYQIIPNKFKYFDKELLFGLSVDTAVDEKHRGELSNLETIFNLVHERLIKEKIYFVYGVPNSRFYKVNKKLFGWKDIGLLKYFVIPIRINKKNYISPLMNFIFSTINFLTLKASIKKIFRDNNKKIFQLRFGKEEENFKNFNKVNIINNDNFRFAYKIKSENKFYTRVKVLYIFDFLPMTKETFLNIVSFCKKNFSDIEFIMYLSNNSEKKINLHQIPIMFLKDEFIATGKILEKGHFNEDIFKDKNWNINLSNFDVK